MSELLSALSDYQAKDPEQALDAAVAAVRSYCGWVIAPSGSETVNVWSDGDTLCLKTLNLTAVTSVTQDGAVVAPASYTFEPYGVINGYFGRSTRVAVVFVHGYADWPDDVRDVILALAQRSLSDSRGLVSKSIGPFTESYGPQLGEAEKVKLAKYVVPGFA